MVHFLCSDEQSKDLSDFVRRVFKALDVTDSMERVSSHYLEERYFVGKIDGGQLKIALSDEVGFDDLPYWLSIEIDVGSGTLVNVDMFIRKALSTSGIRIAKIENFGKKNMFRVDY